MSSGLLQEGKNEGHSMSVSPLTNVYEILPCARHIAKY